MNWSGYQNAIFGAVEHTNDSILIEATAGSGKTSTIVEAIKHVPRNQSVIFLAFNKHIADELKRRISSPNAECKTLHSVGFKAWRDHLAKNGGSFNCRIENGKTRMIIKDYCTPLERARYGEDLAKMVSLAKGSGIVPQGMDQKGLLGDSEKVWDQLISFYNLDADGCNTDVTRKVLKYSIELSSDMIDFDDMLFLPVISDVRFDKYDVIFLDEAQDVNSIQVEIVDRMRKPTSRVVAVGDRHQCQPTGTIVRTPTGCVPIESIKNGDRVVSVDISHSCFKASGDLVTAVSKRKYFGNMVTVISSGRESSYTPNHRCVVNAKPLEKKFAVYIMQKGKNFRIGSTQFGVTNGSGVRTRLLTEKADKLWVLSVWDTKSEACLEEAILGHQWNIPEKTFISQTAQRDGKGLNQPLLDAFWKSLEGQYVDIKPLLDEFNLLKEFPLVSKDTAHDFKTRRPSIVRACNLIPGMLVLHSEKNVHYKKHAWKPINDVFVEFFDGDVFSLNVDGKHTYIADGIATHNSIYGFRGALSGSMDHIAQRFGCKQMPLTVSYRCPKSIVKKAQEFVKHIQHHDAAIEGLVIEYPETWFLKDFKSTDAILCRNSKPLISTAFLLIRNKISCRVLGRDIGQGLIKLIKKMKAVSVPDLISKLARYREKEIEKARARDDEARIQFLDDKLETIGVFIDESGPETTVDILINEIDALFSDTVEGRLVLSTVHKSKGLEFDRVFVLDAHILMPSKYAKKKWQMEQELNLQYVACTRSKGELYYLSGESLREGDPPVKTEKPYFLPVGRIEEEEAVMAAIAEGRHADDIWLIDCPTCGIPSYWNQGSHCTCRKCSQEMGDYSDEAYTLQDYWDLAPYPCDEKKTPNLESL